MNELPPYVYCDHCDEKHFLNFNRDIQGRWSVGYVEFVTHTAIHTGNEFETIELAVEFVKKDLND